jgi:hypothetical protein
LTDRCGRTQRYAKKRATTEMIQNEFSPAPEEIVLSVRTVPNMIFVVAIRIITCGRSIVNSRLYRAVTLRLVLGSMTCAEAASDDCMFCEVR